MCGPPEPPQGPGKEGTRAGPPGRPHARTLAQRHVRHPLDGHWVSPHETSENVASAPRGKRGTTGHRGDHLLHAVPRQRLDIGAGSAGERKAGDVKICDTYPARPSHSPSLKQPVRRLVPSAASIAQLLCLCCVPQTGPSTPMEGRMSSTIVPTPEPFQDSPFSPGKFFFPVLSL